MSPSITMATVQEAKQIISQVSSPADVEKLVNDAKYSFYEDHLTVRVIFKMSPDPYAMITRLVEQDPLRAKGENPGQSSNQATEYMLIKYLAVKWQEYNDRLAKPWVGKPSKLVQTMQRRNVARRLILHVLGIIRCDRHAETLLHFPVVSKEFIEFSKEFQPTFMRAYLKFVAGRCLTTGNVLVSHLLGFDEGLQAIVYVLKEFPLVLDKTQVYLLFGEGNLSESIAKWSLMIEDSQVADNLISLGLIQLIDPYTFLFGVPYSPVHKDYQPKRAMFLVQYHQELDLLGYLCRPVDEYQKEKKTELSKALLVFAKGDLELMLTVYVR